VAKEYAVDYTIPELETCFLSHDIENGEEVYVGAAMPIARAAILMAHLTHGPDIRVGISYTYTNLFHIPKLATLRSEVDFHQTIWAEGYYRDEDLLMEVKWWAKKRRFFIGAVQIDRYGNSNLIGVGDNYKALKFRGPGGIGTPTISANAKYFYIMVDSHAPRIFVDKCDYISSVGWGEGGADARKKLGLPGGGPKYVLTPLCIMDFEENTKRMRLKSVHRGVSVQQVVENTGFELIIPGEVPTTEPPTKEELEILRTRVDVEGFLRAE